MPRAASGAILRFFGGLWIIYSYAVMSSPGWLRPSARVGAKFRRAPGDAPIMGSFIANPIWHNRSFIIINDVL